MKGKARSGLYITDLEKSEKSDTEDKEDMFLSAGETKSTLNPMKKSSAKYFKENKEEFGKTRDHFLAYIINDQTKFADFNKIDSFYLNSIMEYTTKMNVQSKILMEKNEKLRQLEETINEVKIIII